MIEGIEGIAYIIVISMNVFIYFTEMLCFTFKFSL